MIRFLKDDGSTDPAVKSSLVSPIQQFRWIHFPPNDEALTNPGIYNYRVTALFMDANGKINPINSGDVQEATANLCNETYPGELNVAFTRGFIASQAFINNFGDNKDISTLLAGKADDGLKFVAKDPAKQAAAFEWMGYKSRRAILDLLDNAVKDVTAQVRVAAFDLNEPEVVSRLVKLGGRLKVIIDDSKSHNGKDTAETQAATMLTASAGAANVIRGHLGSLQHNKIIAVSGSVQMAVCGSTNFSLRGFLVQSNNAIIVHGAGPVKLFFDDFDNMFKNPNNPAGFGSTASAQFVDLQLPSVKAQIAFSPHSSSNAMLQTVADDLNKTSSNLFYSLAFLNITPGPIKEGIKSLVKDPNKYVTGLADSNVSGLDIQLPGGSKPISFPAALLAKNVPPPFKTEVTGGHGVRLHHKFLVIDFDQPDKARVWMGSYNFSNSADRKNGENLVLLQDQRVAVSYMIEAVSMFDHYRFRDATENPPKKISLKTPPNAGEPAWWAPFFDVKDPKNRDMKLFCPMV